MPKRIGRGIILPGIPRMNLTSITPLIFLKNKRLSFSLTSKSKCGKLFCASLLHLLLMLVADHQMATNTIILEDQLLSNL